jgi:DNA polymerase-3 subunit beta
LTIVDGKIVMANPDDKGETTMPADTDGQGSVRVDGKYLAEVLKACGGMVDLKLVNAYSPMLFVTDGCQMVVMPMITDIAKAQMDQDRQAKDQAEASKTEQKQTKHSRKKEAVAVA